MEQHAVATGAWVVQKSREIPIHARYGSKFSLWISFAEEHSIADDTCFDGLRLEIDGEVHELGPCRLIWEPNIEGYAGRLVLADDIQDFESLFFADEYSGRPVTLDSAFVNVKLLLNHKNSIRDAFKDFVADLVYDLGVFQNAFDTLDAEYVDEPAIVQEAILQVIANTEGARFYDYLDESHRRLHELVNDLGKTEAQRHGFYFRKQLWNILLRVPIMARTNLKPRGYAGDSEMMRMLYAQSFEGDSTFSKLLHKHAVDRPAAEAVRNRRNTIADWFSEVSGRNRQRMLSVACGPAQELDEILRTPGVPERLSITLFDQDQYALLEAARLIDGLERAIDRRVSVEYLRESVRTMLVAPRLRDRWGNFDLIYSMGLFDYLTPPVAKAVLNRLYQLLNPGGEMMIGNFCADNPNRHAMEYWLDWVIYHRTEEEFLELATDLPSDSLTVHTDGTGIQMFLRVTKKP